MGSRQSGRFVHDADEMAYFVDHAAHGRRVLQCATAIYLIEAKSDQRLPLTRFAPRRMTVSIDGEPDDVRDFPFPGNGYQFEAIEAARCIGAGQTESETMPLDETVRIMQTMDEIRRQLGVKYPMEN